MQQCLTILTHDRKLCQKIILELKNKKKTFTIFREEATPALAGSHVASILVKLEFGMLVFVQGGKPERLEKNPWSKVRTKDKLNPHMAQAGLIPIPHWWEQALTTVPSPLLKNLH